MHDTVPEVYHLDLSKYDQRPFYSYQGRIGRATFITWNVILMFCCLALLLLSYLVFSQTNKTDWVQFIFWLQEYANPSNIFFYLYNAFIWYFITVFTIKRVHDMGYSGWLALLNIVPILNILFLFWLVMKKGQLQENVYGAPRLTKGWESLVAYATVIIGVFLLLIFVSAFSQALRL
ncbi:DUF805 domain-containing protein [Acinetobacter sp. 187]|uniref:DUF805 domain-containing protein n=1 Tax=Acinetobacter lanii TaxID=2715163 RepID=UPI00140B0191|nr:DUF805 domain-containing protein [Acinetobacter lanii]NHC03778.1 DUF805 domain-containing protein [Acinetobacter lanii]